ncbi:MAG: hypothetical protein LBE89_04370 [Helicobacteraceae bacterium]|jgi:hypothetical protein|nr:hypothetical protein [Helicobacteraceae bacterium]
MAQFYQMDFMCEEARDLSLYLAFKIPQEEWANNEDKQRVRFIGNEVLQSKFEEFLDYDAIMDELARIRQKYEDKPNLAILRAEEKIAQQLAKTA